MWAPSAARLVDNGVAVSGLAPLIQRGRNVLYLGAREAGPYTYIWNGRNAAGTILPAGKYRIVQTLTDTALNLGLATFSVTLSKKKLAWHSASPSPDRATARMQLQARRM